MDILIILAWVLVGYFLLVFVGLRLVAPFMGFGKYPVPENIPSSVVQAIKDLENMSFNKEEYVKAVYSLVLEKTKHQWGHTRFKAGTHLHRLFVKDLNEIWNSKEFLYCTAINYVGFTMLVNSKFFTAKDIRVRHTFLNFVQHQYLQVKVWEAWVDFDPAGAGIRGSGIGSHASFFG